MEHKKPSGISASTRPAGAAHVPFPKPGTRPREWAHVVLRTARADELIAWYCNVLGAQTVIRHPMISFITWDDSQDRMAFINDPNAGSLGKGRVDHFALTLHSYADLAATYHRLAGQGINPALAVNHGVASSLYYDDPDGNRVELSIENFPDVESLNAWFESGDFDINPYGVVMPAAALMARIEALSEGAYLPPEPDHRTWLRDHFVRPPA